MDVTLSFISDTKTEFTYFDKVADKIESAVYSLVKSITKIRTLMIFSGGISMFISCGCTR